MGLLKPIQGKEFMDCEGPDLREVEVLRATDESSDSRLRLCVHHGRHLKIQDTFVEVCCDKGQDEEKIYHSSAVPASSCPTWEYSIEIPWVSSVAKSIEIRIMRNGIFPTQSGTAYLHVKYLPKAQRVELPVKYEASLFASAARDQPCLVVAWQILRGSDVKTDLCRAANLGKLAMQKCQLHFQANVKSLSLRRKAEPEETIRLKLSMQHASDKPQVLLDLHAHPTESKKMMWSDEVGQANWKLLENEIGLGMYTLQIEVLNGNEQLGSWKERVSELYDSIKNSNLQLHFRGVLMVQQRPAGEFEMMLDIGVSNRMHQKPPLLKAKLSMRKGIQDGEEEDSFYLHVAAAGVNEANPVLKVFSEQAEASGEDNEYRRAQELESGESIQLSGHWTNSFPVFTRPDSSRVRIELWSDRSSSKLLGQAVILEEFAERLPCWKHIYGAARAPYVEEEAEEMASGRRPASTIHGSLFVYFSNFSGKMPGFAVLVIFLF